MALAGQLQIAQRVPIQVPPGFRCVRVQRHRIGSGDQGLLERHIRGITAAWPVSEEHAVGVDDRQRWPHEIGKVYQAFVNLLVQSLARASPNAVPVLERKKGALKSIREGEAGRERWPHEIGKVYQAFVNLLVQSLARASKNAVPVLHPDRKSTRLNSSHLGSSY